MQKYPLSVLREDLLLINQIGDTLTVGELRATLSDHDHNNWFRAVPDTWEPDAWSMVRRTIEDASEAGCVPGWYQAAMDTIDDDVIKQIDDILVEMFKKNPKVVSFYRKGDPIDLKN